MLESPTATKVTYDVDELDVLSSHTLFNPLIKNWGYT